MKYLLCVAYLILCGCSTSDPLIRTVQVKVPVYQACEVDVPAEVPYATEGIKKTDSDFDKIKKILIELSQRKQTETELRALLGVCTKEP